jgi:F-type H+-transporting ATPase subunit alpha
MARSTSTGAVRRRFRPAIDIAKSVSRIGGQAACLHLTGRPDELDYPQFLDLECLPASAPRLEASMEMAISARAVLREILSRIASNRCRSNSRWLAGGFQ